jgi:hypothetical protein
MHWQREALEQRLIILREQLHEQMVAKEDQMVAKEDDVCDWLERQIDALMSAAACSGYTDFVAREIESFRMMAATR